MRMRHFRISDVDALAILETNRPAVDHDDAIPGGRNLDSMDETAGRTHQIHVGRVRFDLDHLVEHRIVGVDFQAASLSLFMNFSSFSKLLSNACSISWVNCSTVMN